jgi:hypothetical protein
MLLAIVYRVVCLVLRLILTRERPVSAAEIELLVLRHERRVRRGCAGGHDGSARHVRCGRSRL